MSSFALAIPKTLRWEGGYVNHPADKGGETNFGITKKRYPDLDIKNLSMGDAIKIYRRDWWDKYGFGQIDNQAVANNVFDFTVNAGPKNGAKYAQKVLNEMGMKVSIDGKWGPQTRGAINKVDPQEFNSRYTAKRIYHYKRLADLDDTQKVFLRGWLRRADDFGQSFVNWPALVGIGSLVLVAGSAAYKFIGNENENK